MIGGWGGQWLVALGLLCVGDVLRAADWELAREDRQRDIQVYVREQADSDYREFQARTNVTQAPATVLAVLADINAWPQWLARIRKVELLKRQPDNSWVYVIYKLPYPFAERDAVLHSTLQRDATTGVMTIRSLSVSHVPWPSAEQRIVHLNKLSSTWRLTPLPNGGTRIELWGQGEPGGYMPALIFNYNLADEPLHSLRLLRQMLLRPQYQSADLRKKHR